MPEKIKKQQIRIFEEIEHCPVENRKGSAYICFFNDKECEHRQNRMGCSDCRAQILTTRRYNQMEAVG